MGEDKKGEKKGKSCCSGFKLFAALILVAGLIVGGSVVLAKATDHPEWNLISRIMSMLGKVEDKIENRVDKIEKKVVDIKK